jgi:hypothetical protein
MAHVEVELCLIELFYNLSRVINLSKNFIGNNKINVSLITAYNQIKCPSFMDENPL